MKKIITIVAVLSMVFCFSGAAMADSAAFSNSNAGASATGGSASASGGNASAVGGAASTTVGDIVSGNTQGVTFENGAIKVEGDTFEASEQKDVTTVHNKGDGYRGFANQVEITYPGMPSYFGPAVRNGNVRGVQTIIMYKDTFTRTDVKALLKGVSVDENRTVPEIDEKKDTDTLKVVLIPPDKADVKRQCAVINAQATDENASSVNALAAAIISALDSGADTLLITAEGAGCKLKSNGWGVGLAWTTSVISSSENTGSTGSGGTGITGGTAGYHSLPWIQGIALDLK